MKGNIFLAIGSGFVATTLLALGAGAQAKNLSDIAILEFYPAEQGNSFAVGTSPTSVIFDPWAIFLWLWPTMASACGWRISWTTQ